MERIDEIKAKDRSELTDDDFEYLVEWEAAQKVKEKEWQLEQERLQSMYDAVIEIERANAEKAAQALEEMKALALAEYLKAGDNE